MSNQVKLCNALYVLIFETQIISINKEQLAQVVSCLNYGTSSSKVVPFSIKLMGWDTFAMC